MTSKFLFAFAKTLPWEKGFESAAAALRIHDSGGATMDGISDAADGKVDGLANYPRCGIMDKPIADLTPDDVKSIYFAYWWTDNRCEEVNDRGLAALWFDCSVNLGAGGGGRIVQSAINALVLGAMRVRVDGDVGPVTIAAMNALPAVELNNKICDLRTAHYKKVRPDLTQLVKRSESYRIIIPAFGFPEHD